MYGSSAILLSTFLNVDLWVDPIQGNPWLSPPMRQGDSDRHCHLESICLILEFVPFHTGNAKFVSQGLFSIGLSIEPIRIQDGHIEGSVSPGS